MRRLLVAAFGLLVLAAVGWSVLQKERILRDGEVLLVPLGPRDPRSLMQGDYMVLRYDVPDRINAAARQRGQRRGLLVVQRDLEGRASFQRLHEEGEELTARERLVKYVWRGNRVDVGAPSFFFQEGAADRYTAARFGELRLAEDGSTVLVGLRDAQLNPLGGEEQEPADDDGGEDEGS